MVVVHEVNEFFVEGLAELAKLGVKVFEGLETAGKIGQEYRRLEIGS